MAVGGERSFVDIAPLRYSLFPGRGRNIRLARPDDYSRRLGPAEKVRDFRKVSDGRSPGSAPI